MGRMKASQREMRKELEPEQEQEQEGGDSLALGNPAMRMAMIRRSECLGGGSRGWSEFIYINDILMVPPQET